MDMRKLQYFLAIAEEGQITKAAKRLYIAQPPLSQQLKLLEDELGVRLIERSGSRKIKLTAAGQALRIRAEQMMELSNKTVKELKDIEEGSQGTLPIGITTSWDATFLPKKINTFHEQYPGVSFQVWEGDSKKIEELLHSGVVEIGITRIPADLETYQSVALPDEPIVAAFNPEAAYAVTTGSVRLVELADKPLIICYRHEALLNYYREVGLEPMILCRHNDVRSMLAWAAAGLGIAIVPKSATNFIPSNKLSFKEIIEPPLRTMSAAVIWMRNRYLSAAARHFVEIFPKV
ncbi:HTH-type transcriptional regulator CynR [Sporomusa silvacetica DSM 10669]|uniref:HTH-type transcriptional regulator CynR n=1 Tax=Sporomusa silvacetica DSM 10669 TaxID=1123289 RepID=A0ABZ3ILF5_9FIRM|nr:LysR family transcriptional regulator [Sporomusa silvacetica]OZC23037.1 HTH-type transcriptional regulator CynR [Sporomusa silvacetica DSM 10669]